MESFVSELARNTAHGTMATSPEICSFNLAPSMLQGFDQIRRTTGHPAIGFGRSSSPLQKLDLTRDYAT
jgi:hypothetical protein